MTQEIIKKQIVLQKAVYFNIEGNGFFIRSSNDEPDDKNGQTPDQCAANFEDCYNDLPKGTYTVKFGRNPSNRKGENVFRFFKDSDPYGGSAKVLPIAAVGDNDETKKLREEIAELKRKAELSELESKWMKKFEGMEARYQSKIGELEDSGLQKFLGIVAPIVQQVATSSTTAKPIGSAQPAQVNNGTGSDDVADNLEIIHNALGADEARTAKVFSKLAEIAKNSPERFNNYVKMLTA